MYQISETELTNRINTFIAKKSEQFPQLHMGHGRLSGKTLSRYDMRGSSFLEKMNESWSQWIHA